MSKNNKNKHKKRRKLQIKIPQKLQFWKHIKFLNWNNKRIGTKYLTAFSIAAILFLIAGTMMFFQLNDVQKDIIQVEEESIRANDVAALGSLFQTKDLHFADFIITRNDFFVSKFEETSEEFDKLAKKIEPNMTTKKQKDIFELLKHYDEEINEMFHNTVERKNDNDLVFNQLRTQSGAIRNITVDLTKELIEIVQSEQAKTTKSASNSISTSIIILIVTNIVAIGLGVGIVLLISRVITNQLKKIVNIMSEVADGNLSVPSMDYQGEDEVGQLALAINTMKENIRNILLKVTDASMSVTDRSEALTQSSDEVKEGSEQIAKTMEDLSSGAEVQANSASNLSENMITFVEDIRSSEQNGKEIAHSSEEVLTVTNEGAALMREAVEQMKQIDTIVSEAVNQVQGLDKQSGEISHLVLVIKDIADQTNLLALNAAIEAARAGEHGKGFAVVADEVRKLAEEVTASVSEITNIVDNIQSETGHVVESLNVGYQEVKEGTKQIEVTGKNFKNIYTSTSDMVDKILSISSNLQNIANDSTQMNELIEEIASVSEESAAGVEEAAASSQQSSSAMDEISYSAEELRELAEQLDREVRVFKL